MVPKIINEYKNESENENTTLKRLWVPLYYISKYIAQVLHVQCSDYCVHNELWLKKFVCTYAFSYLMFNLGISGEYIGIPIQLVSFDSLIKHTVRKKKLEKNKNLD